MADKKSPFVFCNGQEIIDEFGKLKKCELADKCGRYYKNFDDEEVKILLHKKNSKRKIKLLLYTPNFKPKKGQCNCSLPLWWIKEWIENND